MPKFYSNIVAPAQNVQSTRARAEAQPPCNYAVANARATVNFFTHACTIRFCSSPGFFKKYFPSVHLFSPLFVSLAVRYGFALLHFFFHARFTLLRARLLFLSLSLSHILYPGSSPCVYTHVSAEPRSFAVTLAFLCCVWPALSAEKSVEINLPRSKE